MKAEIITPSLTIFNEDSTIDYKGCSKLMRYLIDNGVDGIVPLGTTGEFPQISFDDKKSYLTFLLSEISNEVKILPGTGCLNLKETIDLSNHAIKKGADGVLLIGHYYFDMSQSDIYHYYDTLAKQIDGDIYLYNFPNRTSTDFKPETVLELLYKNSNIVGMKESVGSFSHTRDIMQQVKKEFPEFKMYSGFDDQFLDNIDFGGSGSIGGLSNLFPKLWSDWVYAKNHHNHDDILKIKSKIHKLMRLYTISNNIPALFKNILKYQGIDINTKCLFPYENIDKKLIEQAILLIDSIE